MSEQPITVEIKERDKPFVLAMSAVVLFAGEVGAAVYATIAYPQADLSILKEAITATIGLLSTAWTYYLVRKNGKKE